jgi:glutamate/tyrosine decarboxylase-like PLP-dependent enzyme
MIQKTFPQNGRPWEEIETTLIQYKDGDIDWRRGRSLRSIWIPFELTAALDKAFVMFINESALNRDAFPSVVRLENEVIQMAAEILNGDRNTVGNVTTGGTESIFLAVKSARDYARANKKNVSRPNIVLPQSAHPAFLKAADYMDLEVIMVPTREDRRADVAAMREAITRNTIFMVGSAPEFSFGVMDPIEELGSVAIEKNVWMHVDACVGGYFAPFARKLGYTVTAFDFSVPGVVSISADNHKMGFAHKPCSTILYRKPDYLQYQGFKNNKWPRGMYNVPTFTGTRSAGPIAAAWAALKILGEDGYMKQAERVMKARQVLLDGVSAIPELKIVSNPELCIFAFESDVIDVKIVAKKLTSRNWYFGLNHNPPSIHLFLAPFHDIIADGLLGDLRESIDEVKAGLVEPRDMKDHLEDKSY